MSSVARQRSPVSVGALARVAWRRVPFQPRPCARPNLPPRCRSLQQAWLPGGSSLGVLLSAGVTTACADVDLVRPRRVPPTKPGNYRASQQKRPLHRPAVWRCLSTITRARLSAKTEELTRVEGRARFERREYRASQQILPCVASKSLQIRLFVRCRVPETLYRAPRQVLPKARTRPTVCLVKHYRVLEQLLPCASTNRTVRPIKKCRVPRQACIFIVLQNSRISAEACRGVL